MNTLQDVEALLKGVRAAQGVTFAYLRERGLYPNTVRRMEEGGEYSLASLFKYLYFLNQRLFVNDEPVTDPEQFGAALAKARHSLCLTMEDVQRQQPLQPRTIVNIEHGRGYQRHNLLNYLKVVPVKVEMKDISDLFY